MGRGNFFASWKCDAECDMGLLEYGSEREVGRRMEGTWKTY